MLTVHECRSVEPAYRAVLSRASLFKLKIVVGTVKPVLSGLSKIDKTKILMTNGSIMKVKSISVGSPWSILKYF